MDSIACSEHPSCESCLDKAHERLYEVRNARGQIVALVCDRCYEAASAVVTSVSCRFGAHYVDGVCVAGPIGSPSYRSLDEAKAILSRLDGSGNG